MVRLPRFLPSMALACSISLPLVGALPVWAQAQGPEAARPAPDAALTTAVENFWHYGKIARYDLAANEAKTILEKKDDPTAVLDAFVAVSSARNDNLDTWLLRWQGVDPMRDGVNQIIAVLAEGYRARRSSPAFIEQNIQRLIVNERAYTLAVGRLRESGELAIPMMLDYLRDPSKSQYQPAIRRAMRDMGRQALNPLVAATVMTDQGALATVASVLGEIGYESAAPYLAKLAQSPDSAQAVKSAATDALRQMGINDPANVDTAQKFFQLAEQFYYANATIGFDARNPMAYVWSWDDRKGLLKTDVPPQIFNDVMTMRASAQALEINPKMADAVSLWLAGDYKREADLPAGDVDASRSTDSPDAHYYGVAAGTRYLGPVLARAQRDRNSAVALRALRSLEQIAGQSNLFSGEGQPIIDALGYADRLVRFEAAMTLASAMPQQQFSGAERVVPILAEALAQTGKPQVVVVAASQDTVNQLVEGLKGEIGVAGATTPQGASDVASKLPTVDVVIANEDLGGEIDRLRAVMAQTPKLQSAVLLIVTKTQASPFGALTVNNPMVMVTQAADAKALSPVIAEARAHGMSLAIDEKVASQYALRAADLLKRLAIGRNQVLNPADAQQALLATLNDARPDLVKAAGEALALIGAPEAQRGLLDKAVAEQTSEDVKISLYNSLATNAKFFANQLQDAQIAALQKVVAGDSNLQVRSAAAEARGALNLPTDEATQLVLGANKPAKAGK